MTTRLHKRGEDNVAQPTLLAVGRTKNPDLRDTKLDIKVVLSGLWITTMFVFAYVDIFGFWRADVINGALAGKVPGTGAKISDSFLVYTTIYILIPSLMILFSLTAPAKMNRRVNLIVSLVYGVSVVVSVIGESWIYFIVGSVVEVFLLLAITRVAWTWPLRQATDRADAPSKDPLSKLAPRDS